MNLKEQRDEIMSKTGALIEKVRKGEELTQEEKSELDALKEKATSLADQFKRAEEAESLMKSLGSREVAVREEEPAQAHSLGEYFVQGAKTQALPAASRLATA